MDTNIGVLIGSFIAALIAYFKGRADGKRKGKILLLDADRLAKDALLKKRDKDAKNDATIDALFKH